MGVDEGAATGVGHGDRELNLAGHHRLRFAMTRLISIVSGHPANWHAGASTCCLHAHRELVAAGRDADIYHLPDYASRRLPGSVAKFTTALDLWRALGGRLANRGVVEVAGNLGWRTFERLRATAGPDGRRRPLLVARIHGLEFLDEQARITEEIAGGQRLPWKYKAVSRHWINYQERRTLAAADVAVFLTSRDADAALAAGWISDNRVAVVPGGVESEFLVSGREYRPAGTRLLWWGSWVERKGTRTLPRAFEMACRERPDLTLTIGGTGGPADAIRGQFAQSVRDKVTVLPFVTDEEHRRLLLDHDVFVFPSLSEGYGLSLLEAMAGGLPAITTFTGMGHDALEHDRNCVLVPMAAATPLTRAIVALAGDPDRRARIGAAAAVTATQLSWAEFGRRTAAVYDRFADKLGLVTAVAAVA